MCLGNLSTIYWRINIRLTPLKNDKKITRAHKTPLIMVKTCVLVCVLSVSDMFGLLCKTMGLSA